MPRFTQRVAFLFVLALMPTNLVSGQERRPDHSLPLEIHGQVRLARGGAPAANVLVKLESQSGGVTGQVITDRTGKFRFPDLVPAQYILVVSAPGFRTLQQQVDLETQPTGY